MTVKATFHMESGDFTMTFEGQKTFRKINHSKRAGHDEKTGI